MDRIPRLVRNSTNQWDHQYCRKWAFATLVSIIERIKESGPPEDAVWRLDFSHKSWYTMRQLTKREVEESVACGEDRIGFLPRAYFQLVERSHM